MLLLQVFDRHFPSSVGIKEEAVDNCCGLDGSY